MIEIMRDERHLSHEVLGDSGFQHQLSMGRRFLPEDICGIKIGKIAELGELSKKVERNRRSINPMAKKMQQRVENCVGNNDYWIDEQSLKQMATAGPKNWIMVMGDLDPMRDGGIILARKA